MRKLFLIRHNFQPQSLAVLGIALVILWTAIAPLFLVLNFIDFASEKQSYSIAFFLILILVFVYACHTPEPSSTARKTTVVFGTIISLLFVVISCSSSNTFVFWKMRTISQKEWSEMASDLKGLANKPRELIMQMPKSFDHLGSKSDYCFFYSGSEPCVLYGCRGADEGYHWGLMMGTKHLNDVHTPEIVERFQITKDVYFFYDPN